MAMSKKPTQKKTPLVIEPLNWVAPEVQSKEALQRKTEEKENAKKAAES